ncbi:hypothetical protein [Burkholderia cepacia]|uniref:Uncharacterized protein n=1 Tax=Burkholderia cepacia TaxID=292 RepID=A0AA88ZDD4_BURCE|nr:hypothetical protein [Burkholderia cepacia]KGC07871.1 hypothetical protein DM43_5916 [Burkholderia cepacia]
MAERRSSDCERVLNSCLETLQNRVSMAWKGREKEALISLVRVLDYVAAASIWGLGVHDETSTSKTRTNPRFALMGAAAALRPFLSAVKNLPGGVPWGPSQLQVQQYSYSYLHTCGELIFLRRMAALEHYGLATSEREGAGQFRIKAVAGARERALMAASQALGTRRPEVDVPDTDVDWSRVHARMASYVDTPDDWSICYENDSEIVSIYRNAARQFGHGFFEAEALPDDVIIGDRSFGEWKHACEQALGRILAHMNFARLLQKKIPTINLGDVLTIFARKDDLRDVWEEAGIPEALIPATMKALTLDVDGLDDWDKAFETPTPFYVDLGKDFALLPCFGALINPYFALFRHLRQFYKADWDRGVDRREEAFRADLARLFTEPRFIVPPQGFRLQRADGTMLTDIDAIIIDRGCGSVALVQLKWHDVFGFSLSERESRRRNIIKANDWTSKVSEWVGSRSSQEILQQFRIDIPVSDRPPLLYVIARYMARFSGAEDQDTRAFWLGWPEIENTAKNAFTTSDPLEFIPMQIMRDQKKYESPFTQNLVFQFPDLAVNLEIGASP